MGCVSCAGALKERELMENQITLGLREPTTIPIEADNISPDRFAGLELHEIAVLPLYYGRQKLTIADLFTLKGGQEGAENIVLKGDLSHAKRIGQRMTRGRITILGHAGMHLGAEMRGGEIIVRGNAAAWTGAQMAGGKIEIQGDAGPMLGAAYPGETRGMRGGVITVEGNAGWRVGERMRRGLIAVQGDAGEFAGVRMIAGSIFVFGRLGGRAGARMKRGTIVALGDTKVELLPTFRYQCTYRPSYLPIYLRRLRDYDLAVKSEHIEGQFRRYSGDITELGKGEILIYDKFSPSK